MSLSPPTPKKQKKQKEEINWNGVQFQKSDAQILAPNWSCKLCSEKIGQTDAYYVRRHYERHHVDQLRKYVEKKRKPAALTMDTFVKKASPSLDHFLMFAATSTFSRSYVRNKHLQVNFKILLVCTKI